MGGALCLGLDRRWRRRAAELLRVPADAEVLDVATGAGAMAMEIAQQLGPRGRVVGCDINQQLLGVAREQATRARTWAQIDLLVADATALPFVDQRFDAVALGFAIEDMSDRRQCARELFRVLAPGGRLVLLEFAGPNHPLIQGLYVGYLGLVFGGIGAPHSQQRSELLSYPGRATVPELLREVGFVGHTCERVAAGVVCIHAADRPSRAG